MRAIFLLTAGLALAATASPSISATNLVQNGSFEDATATGKNAFFSAGVAGWQGGYGLTFLDYPGTADDGSYLSVYGPFPKQSPDGGKFVEGDGDPGYSDPITQTINGLTVGHTYELSFYQAAGQQLGFTGPTTERWQVSFGNETKLSDQFSLAQAGVGQWQQQKMSFVATATSQVLSFLASGTPNGAPPISFLDGVSLTQAGAVPEPSSWAMMIGGVGMAGGALRRRRPAATPRLA